MRSFNIPGGHFGNNGTAYDIYHPVKVKEYYKEAVEEGCICVQSAVIQQAVYDMYYNGFTKLRVVVV